MALPQEVLRARLRAARVLADLTIQELAARLPAESELGERTLRKLESGESKLKPPVIRELAVALDLPYVWFTIPSIAEELSAAQYERDLAALESRIAALETQPADRPSPLREPAENQGPGRRGPRGSRQGHGQ